MAAGVTGIGAGAAPPASLSRYRSKRRAQQQQQQQQQTPEPATPAIPSRYRHRSASLTRQNSSPPEQAETPPPVPALPLGGLSNHAPITRSADPLLTGGPLRIDTFKAGERIDEDDGMPRPRTKDSGKSFREERSAPPTPWVDAPTSFGYGTSQPELGSPKSRRSPLFSFFSRGRKEGSPLSPLSPPASVPSSPPASRADVAPRFIEPGGRGIVPQVDAPTSASNAGDRRVVVRCMETSVTLPVSTDTTPTAILHSAANLITHKINPETSLLLESYLQYGLERRLRRYERVRDVMNSWDGDTLNALVVIPSDIPENDRDLSLASVPRTPDAPYDFCLQMHHCPRVGKWNKRYITLAAGGQVFASKKSGAGQGDKDALSLCHLSDFDVYSPTEHQIRKVLKPPKKFCYAVKSQQKSSVFPTGGNFVHFFCTDDAGVAERFQAGVHGWRSWYLVNRKTDVQELQALQGLGTKGALGRRVSTRDGKGRGSGDDTPYAIGSFRPLMDMEAFNKPYDEPARRTRASQETQSRAGPPRTQESVQRRLSKGSNGPPRGRAMSMRSRDANIDANGLLGDAYEERKEEQRRRDEALRSQPEENPFTGGASLINNIPAAPYESPPRARDASASGRSSSRYRRDASRQRGTRRPSSPGRRPEGLPAPLLDIEAQAAEPTSWREEVTRNRGHGVRAPAGVPLVDLAKGRATAHRFDPATGTFSRGGQGGAVGGGGEEGVFSGDTLVGQVARSQSTASRGVKRSMSTATTRRGRLVEEVPPLPASGTLLARMEAQQRGRTGTVR